MNGIRSQYVRLLLALLNSPVLNQSPCPYGYIGNVDAFSAEHLELEDKARPGITVRTILDEAALFKTCPLQSSGLTVIEGVEVREGTIWDVHELREQFSRKAAKSTEELPNVE